MSLHPTFLSRYHLIQYLQFSARLVLKVGPIYLIRGHVLPRSVACIAQRRFSVMVGFSVATMRQWAARCLSELHGLPVSLVTDCILISSNTRGVAGQLPFRLSSVVGWL